MRIGKEIKRDTLLVVLSVIILTIVTLNVSYSAFFTVQSLSTIQEISTGNLEVDVNINLNGSILSGNSEIFPMTFEDVSDETTGSYASLTLTNTGSINSDFLVTISYDFDRLIDNLEANNECCYMGKTDSELTSYLVSLDYIKVAILDTTTNTLVDFNGDESGEITTVSLSSLTPTVENEFSFPILRDTVNASGSASGTAKSYKIYVWLSDETPTTEIGKYINFKLDVKCAVGTETITDDVEA